MTGTRESQSGRNGNIQRKDICRTKVSFLRELTPAKDMEHRKERLSDKKEAKPLILQSPYWWGKGTQAHHGILAGPRKLAWLAT